MGLANSTAYKDGDIPRESFNNFFDTTGFAYYKTNTQGKCRGCRITTNHWYVTTKSKGRWICQKCYINFDFPLN